MNCEIGNCERLEREANMVARNLIIKLILATAIVLALVFMF